MSELGERSAREEIEREERMEMLIDSGTSILRLCAAFAAQNKGSLCIVQRTEKSLLYEAERALRVPLPIFVAGCLKYGLVVVLWGFAKSAMAG